MRQIKKELKETKTEVCLLNQQLDEVKRELSNEKINNEKMKQAINLHTFKSDALEQYGRRSNLRIHGVPKAKANADDGEEIIIKTAKVLNIDLRDWDLLTAHRIGRKRTVAGKPRPVIARLASRYQFYKKSNLSNHQEFSNTFIIEDLTSLRSKLLLYGKNECENK